MVMTEMLYVKRFGSPRENPVRGLYEMDLYCIHVVEFAAMWSKFPQ